MLRDLLSAHDGAPSVPLGTWRGLTLERELGRGAHGVVLLARDAAGRAFAVKVLRAATDRERFRREAALLARLEHPGLVRLRDAGEEDGVPYLVTDAVLGPSLAEAAPLAPARALAVGVVLARTLGHAHAHGVVHRDVKPSNVLLDAAGPKLVDFGLARDLEHDARLTGTHSLLGTPAFATPEQLVVAKQADARADVFSLAAVVHFALAGSPPFDSPTVGGLFAAMRRGPRPLPARPGLPPGVRAGVGAILGEALRALPEERISMADLAEGLAYQASRIAMNE